MNLQKGPKRGCIGQGRLWRWNGRMRYVRSGSSGGGSEVKWSGQWESVCLVCRVWVGFSVVSEAEWPTAKWLRSCGGVFALGRNQVDSGRVSPTGLNIGTSMVGTVLRFYCFSFFLSISPPQFWDDQDGIDLLCSFMYLSPWRLIEKCMGRYQYPEMGTWGPSTNKESNLSIEHSTGELTLEMKEQRASRDTQSQSYNMNQSVLLVENPKRKGGHKQDHPDQPPPNIG